ncbi:hypothetical protein HHX47_DHR2000550 [Lentinula edodes]|nr:hypothetical protein HHX47_DHR2000550 [Lentinula edodes]
MERVLLEALGGQSRRNGPSVHPPMDLNKLDDLVLFLQSHAIEQSTKNNYSTGARDYVRFCTSHNLSLDPTPSTLSRYIAFTSRHKASGPKYLTGARHYLKDVYPHFDESRSHPLVQATIRGSKKVRADPVKRKPPLRTSHLQQFLELKTKSYNHLLFATLISCCFYGCHRVGELTFPNQKSLRDWRKVIKRSTLKFEAGRAGYHLPYHKGDPFYQGTDILFCSQQVADPVTLLKEYATVRDKLHGARPALFILEDGNVPTRGWFDSMFFAVLSKEFGGHSGRAGGATFYAGLGLQEMIIMALGRWSSSAWKIYIRDNPAVRAELELAAIRRHQSSSS